MQKLILTVPLIIFISVVAAVMLLLLKYWIIGIIVLAIAFILNCWSETFALNCFKHKGDHYDFRLLTYNINRAHDISVNKGSTEELVEFILEQKADIVLLQEYNAELYPLVQEMLNREYPYDSGVNSTSRFKSVFCRFPIESCEQLMVDSNILEYEVFQNRLYSKKQHNGKEILPVSKLLIRIGNNRLQLFNCHLMSNNYSVVVRNLNKKKQSVIHSILSVIHRMDFGYATRELQAKVISEQIESGFPTIVCGDFNDVGGSTCIRFLQMQGLSDVWWKGGFGFGFTFHGMGLRFRLDHILFSKRQIRIQNVFIPYSNASDHDPIICDFTFNNSINEKSFTNL